MRSNLKLVINNPHNKVEQKQFFEKDELKIILDLYAKMVSEGSWKDYGLSISSKQVSFSVFRNAAENALIAFQKWNGVSDLKNIKNETLIIWGDQDKSYNFNQIKILEKEIKNSKVVIFKGCAHNVHLEQPNLFNKTVKNFFL